MRDSVNRSEMSVDWVCEGNSYFEIIPKSTATAFRFSVEDRQ